MDALFWGFFEAGVLKASLASGNLTDPQALMTETYAGGSLNVLALRYPNAFMTADLAALAAPTVSFGTVYRFTDTSLAAIQQSIGATAWAQYGAEITELNPSTYSCQSGLETQLQAAATQTADFREGVAAFLEKREPRFEGR